MTQDKIIECIVTRRLLIKKEQLEFQDYTDWISEETNRIDTFYFENDILVVKNGQIIGSLETADEEAIMGVKR